MFPSPCRQTCWPLLRPTTDWKMNFLRRDTVLPRPWTEPGLLWLIWLPVFLRYLTCRSSTVCCLHTHSCISIHLSFASAITFFHSSLMSTCQSILLRPSITFCLYSASPVCSLQTRFSCMASPSENLYYFHLLGGSTKTVPWYKLLMRNIRFKPH